MGEEGSMRGNIKHVVADLERKLAQAIVERDDLARDVESLCMETTANTTFSSSSVLRERIFSAEKEASTTKLELLTITGERDSLREDLREVREAKRLADQSFREQTARTEALERELTFYRQQAAQAIADRDSTAWDCEQLRLSNAELSRKAKEAEQRAEAATVECSTAERRLKEAQATIAGLREAAAAAEAVPGLRADLSQAGSRVQELEDKVKTLEKKLQEEVEARKAAQKEAKDAQTTANKRLEDLEKAHEADLEAAKAMQGELADVTRQKVDALVRLSEAETARSRADRELSRVQAALKEAQGQLGQATSEKVQALMRVADLKAVAEGAEGFRSPGKNNTPQQSPSKSSPSKTPERRGWFGNGSPTKSIPE